MENKIKKFLKKYILLIWIIAVSLALTGFIVVANYKNNQNVAKKVISTQSEVDIRFSSNYLEESVGVDSNNNNTPKYRNSVSLLNSAETPINIDIRNYGKSNSTLFYPTDINYTLEAVLTDSSGKALSESEVSAIMGNNTVKISITGSNDVLLSSSNRSHTYSRTLHHGSTASIDEFKMYFPSTNTKTCVKLIATPDSIHKDLNTIGAVFSVSDKSSVQGDGWTGRFNDPTNKSPEDYDLFNYIITGYGETNSATIKWDPAVFSLENIGFNSEISVSGTQTGISDPDGWSKMTVSIGAKNQYSFQIFKGAGFDTMITTLTTSWNNAMAGKSAGDEGWISLNDYLWNHISDYIIFDDNI